MTLASLSPYASLPMYDWPEERAQTAATWARVRDGARGVWPEIDLPEGLSVPNDLMRHWRAPALVFSQTCWGLLEAGLSAHLRVLAQPDYGAFTGGRGAFYRSALVARAGAAVAVPEGPGAALPDALLAGQRLAVNGRDSLSGFLALQRDLGADPCALAVACPGTACLVTGSHRASVIAVARGRADLAAIDCRSWALALRHEPCARRLVVIGWTAERPGLPYVTHRASDPLTAQGLRETLLAMGCHPAPEEG